MAHGPGGEKPGVATAGGQDVSGAICVAHRDVTATPGSCLRRTSGSARLPFVKGPVRGRSADEGWRVPAEPLARRATSEAGPILGDAGLTPLDLGAPGRTGRGEAGEAVARGVAVVIRIAPLSGIVPCAE